MSLISVIVPVYKTEPYLRRCIDSILAQTFQDFEIILIDDGSPDNAGNICDEYASKDDRIVVIHQANQGVSAARNTGLDWVFTHSNSQWLTFVDSDDWIHPVMFESLLSAAQKYNTSISVCSCGLTDGDSPAFSEKLQIPTLADAESFSMTHWFNLIVIWGKLYRKECFANVRYPVGKIHEDEIITFQILFPASPFAFIPAPYYAYFTNPTGITKSPWSPRRLDSIEAIEHQIAFFKDHNQQIYTQRMNAYIAECISQLKNILRYGDRQTRKTHIPAIIRKVAKAIYTCAVRKISLRPLLQTAKTSLLRALHIC